EQSRAGNIAYLGAHARNHLAGGIFPFGERLQRYENIAAVRLSARTAATTTPGEPHYTLHRRIVADSFFELPKFLLHQLERNRLIAANETGNASRVLLREETF